MVLKKQFILDLQTVSTSLRSKQILSSTIYCRFNLLLLTLKNREKVIRRGAHLRVKLNQQKGYDKVQEKTNEKSHVSPKINFA